MSLAPATRLGPYEILARIGAGGMGEVYRARDTRLGRIVALKVLPPEFAERTNRRDRFEREARAIASLNHPNVCALHDVGHDDGTHFLVLEYLEGEDLASVLKRGPLSPDRATRLAIQIALSLEAAHRANVFHRDLKPHNIMITRDGLKLVDFGLARIVNPLPAGPDRATLTQRVTQSGQIMGTVQYMAPEQLEGQDGDARSDIFSFGCVFCEMLTGTPAFTGASAASIIAAIMTAEPKALAGPDMAIPPALRPILVSCLAKNPDERFQTARDLRRALEWSLEEKSVIAPHVAKTWQWIAAALALCMILLGTLFWAARNQTKPPSRLTPLRFLISQPQGAWLQSFITQQALAISPSGGRIAMIASDAQGPHIFVRKFDALEPVPLPGTEGASSLFWSADSKYIGFYANGKISKIPAEGGAPVPVAALPVLWSATWSSQGDIIATLSRGSSVRVRADTGEVSPWKPARWPHFLPNGKQLLYVNPENDVLYVYLEDFPSGHVSRLMRSDTEAIYVPAAERSQGGYVLFGLGSTLLAQRLDTQKAKIVGEPVAVAEGVPFFRPTAWAQFDASQDGHLVFGTGVPLARLALLDRSGNELPLPGESRAYFSYPRFDPSFTHIAVDVYDLTTGASDLWVIAPKTGVGQRITFGPDLDAAPVWSPDGRRLAFGSAGRTSPPQLRILNIGLPNEPAADPPDKPAAYPPGNFQLPMDWSPDGRWIAYQTTGGDQPGDIWFASVGADRQIYPVLKQDAFQHIRPAFSPDGKYLAYSANESGRLEVYVQPLDSGTPPRLVGERTRISVQGGTAPRWRRDGRELFFRSLQQDLMSVPVDLKSSSPFGAPVRLFTLPGSVNTMNPTGAGFDVDQTGSKFLVFRRDRPNYLQVILNWQATLK